MCQSNMVQRIADDTLCKEKTAFAFTGNYKIGKIRGRIGYVEIEKEKKSKYILTLWVAYLVVYAKNLYLKGY